MKEYAGTLVLETDVDGEGIDAALTEINAKIDKFKEKEITVGLSTEEEAELDELYKKAEELWQIDLERSRAERAISKEMEQQAEDTEYVVDNLAKTNKPLFDMANHLQDLVDKYREIQSSSGDIISESEIKQAEKLKEEILETLDAIEKMPGGQKLYIKGINDTVEGTKEVRRETNNIGKGLSGLIKKVAKWGLAIFSIRSAYTFVRQAVSTLSQYNKQLATDLQYIRFAMASMLEKTIVRLVNWVLRLLQYINYLSMSWFKVNLFANASADRMQDMASSAKEAKKQLAGFDEMNVISDSSTGGGGIGSPSVDLSKMENFKPPKWLTEIEKAGQWIIEHWKIIVAAIGAVGLALIGIKIAKWIGDAKKAKDATRGLATSFTGFFDGLGKGIEAIAILGGFALVIKEITGLVDTFAQSGLKLTDVIGLMATIIGSLVVLIAALTIASNALQSPLAMAGLLLLTAAIAAILLVIKETLPTILDALGKFITEIGPTLNQILETIGTAIERIIYALGTALPPIINSVGTLFEKIFNGISKVISTVGNVIVKILTTAKDLTTTVLDAILSFINRLGPAINNFVDNVIRAVTKLINFLISGIEYMINTLVINAVRGLFKKINDVIPGGKYDLNLPGYVSIPRFVPKLAKGTILNAPGKGVPVGGYQALAGEAGREAYLPLSDRQLLEELGSTIGRYVTINATIPVYAYNRLVDRQMVRVRAEDNFAGNR